MGSALIFVSAVVRAVRPAWQTVVSTAGRLLARWREARLLHAQEVALAKLDAATLRDLGIDRSEIGSYRAEHAGIASPTRRRVHVRGDVIVTRPFRVDGVDCFL